MKFPVPFHLHASLLPIVASVFLVGAYNQAFWKGFVRATGGAGLPQLPVQAGMFVLLVLAFTACLALVNYRYILKPLLVLLFLATSAASYFMDQYGTAIDWSMVQNIAETNSHESAELLGTRLIIRIILMGALPALAVVLVDLRFPTAKRHVAMNLGTAGAALAACALLLVFMFKPLAPALHEHRELRYLLTPTNYIQAINGYYQRKWRAPVVVSALGTDAAKGVLWHGATHRTVTLLVIGETARAANFSLNGYARQTNPELAQVPGLINFRHMQSCGTATAVSVPCMFSALGRRNYSDSKAQRQEGLLDVLTHAGIDVLWLDNNSGCKGVCDRVRYDDVSIPVRGDPLCNDEECFDERLLRDLPAIIREARNDLLIVLHQKGSHGPAYWKRYPERFKAFGPVCETIELGRCSRASIVAAYDNTILYTDHVLKQAIDLLAHSGREDNVDTALVYVSDHGESLGENNLYLHGAPYVISPREQRHVPFMLWLSEGFRSRFGIDQQCLAARTEQEFDHDYLFHSVLGMLGISTAVYNPKLDLFQACSHAS